MDAPILSLITGKVGRDESFQRLVHSIVTRTDVPWELVVSDASEFAYPSSVSNIRVIHESPRLTCVQGYNAAFTAARGKYCLYLNDDAEVLPGYATEAVKFMEANPRIGLGALHYSENGGPFHVNSSWGVTYANFGIISKQLGDSVGWFDTDLKMYGNDNSLGFRVLLAGRGIADIPEVRVLHHVVQDQARAENQASRLRDNHTLTEKYLPLRLQWLSTFNRHKIGGTVPWSHGVKPGVTVQMVKR